MMKGNANLKTDKEGNRYVELEVVMDENSDIESRISQKRSIERLYNDLSPELSVSEKSKNKTEEEKRVLNIREQKKLEMLKKKSSN